MASLTDVRDNVCYFDDGGTLALPEWLRTEPYEPNEPESWRGWAFVLIREDQSRRGFVVREGWSQKDVELAVKQLAVHRARHGGLEGRAKASGHG